MTMMLEHVVKRSVEHDGASAKSVSTKGGPIDWANPLILPSGSATYFRTTDLGYQTEAKSVEPKLLMYVPPANANS